MIDFEIVKTCHRLFVQRVEFALAGLINERLTKEAVCDHEGCKLGRWLAGAARPLSGLPAYDILLERHKHFHLTAGAALLEASLEASQKGGNAASLVEALRRFKAASTGVVDALDRLAAEFHADGRHLPYISPFDHDDAHGEGAWSESLSVGSQAIDEQHKAIFSILDHLLLMNGQSFTEGLASVLEDLEQLLRMHFVVEEGYMKTLGMPADELKDHLGQHREILDQAAIVISDAASGGVASVKDIAGKVMPWVIDHVVEYDMNIRHYLSAPVLADKCTLGTPG